MPRSAISDYIFYKFTCLDKSVDLRYVGSTADWKQRKRSHKHDCNNENGKKYNYKVYTLIRANGGWDNFKMIEIGKQEQITLREAEYIEEKYRVELNATMNDRRCFLTEEQKKELYENNKEQKQEYNKEWRENNPEHIKEYHKKYAQTETGKAKQALANKKYTQTAEAKASKAIADKKYRAKKKLEKAETAL